MFAPGRVRILGHLLFLDPLALSPLISSSPSSTLARPASWRALAGACATRVKRSAALLHLHSPLASAQPSCICAALLHLRSPLASALPSCICAARASYPMSPRPKTREREGGSGSHGSPSRTRAGARHAQALDVQAPYDRNASSLEHRLTATHALYASNARAVCQQRTHCMPATSTTARVSKTRDEHQDRRCVCRAETQPTPCPSPAQTRTAHIRARRRAL